MFISNKAPKAGINKNVNVSLIFSEGFVFTYVFFYIYIIFLYNC